MVTAARNRRDTFESMQAAIDNYASKPPMQFFDPEVLREYVEHGFEPTESGVTLRCAPQHEARTFETGASHDLFDRLPDVATRVVVVAGVITSTLLTLFVLPILYQWFGGGDIQKTGECDLPIEVSRLSPKGGQEEKQKEEKKEVQEAAAAFQAPNLEPEGATT